MFLEPHFIANHQTQHQPGGWIEVICGSMFSGKTEELIRRLNRAGIARQRLKIFKPALDTRYDIKNIVSHNDNFIHSTPVKSAKEIIALAELCDVVGIDEAQFFEDDLIEVCIRLANEGKRVIVAGLDMDFMGLPFGPMPALMSVAEFVTKVHAICMQCGSVASYSFRLAASKEQFVLGEKQEYEARCRKCFIEGLQRSTTS